MWHRSRIYNIWGQSIEIHRSLWRTRDQREINQGHPVRVTGSFPVSGIAGVSASSANCKLSSGDAQFLAQARSCVYTACIRATTSSVRETLQNRDCTSSGGEFSLLRFYGEGEREEGAGEREGDGAVPG